MKLIAEILHRPKPKHGRSSEGVIGFSFQLAIIQHQLQKLHAFEYCHLHEDEKNNIILKNVIHCYKFSNKVTKYFTFKCLYIECRHKILQYSICSFIYQNHSCVSYCWYIVCKTCAKHLLIGNFHHLNSATQSCLCYMLSFSV